MWRTTERANERPDRRTATPLTLNARPYPPKWPLVRLAGRGAGALVRLIGGVLADWRCRRQRAAAIRDLRAWDDWMLKDIGLTRGEITAAVDGRLERGGRRPGAPAPAHRLERAGPRSKNRT
jgi:uncharacterized protein YjiS (DUF1127 family)